VVPSAQVAAHEDAGEPVQHGGGVGDLGEPGPLEEPAGADVGHGRVDPRALVVDRVALDGGGAVLAGELDGALEQGQRDPLLPVARAHPDAPDAPDVEVVDVGDLAVAGEGRLGPGCDGGPAHDLVA